MKRNVGTVGKPMKDPNDLRPSEQVERELREVRIAADNMFVSPEQELQSRSCSVGEHEAGVAVGQIQVFGADTDKMGTTPHFAVCRHCRCLYAGKP